ncbi:MAG: hypothetical protein N2A42_03075 [Luteolibacter sp.]
MTEYKRFVALAMLAGHPVTPSEEVDQAWHLHLVYTPGSTSLSNLLSS